LPSGPEPAALQVPVRHAFLLAALYLALALHRLGAADVVGDDEAREVGLVQEVAAGHWLWPRFNGEILPDKPILFHWLAALPVAAEGFSETAVRLPSALAGAALVGWTTVLGAQLIGPGPGLVAGVLVATTPAFFTHARVARPDALLVLLLTVALGLAFRWWRDGRTRDATGALVLLGLATFAKGPVAPALFGLTLGAFLAWQGDLRRLPRLFTMPGVAAFLVLGLGWYVVALAGWGGLFVREHLVGRYVRNFAGGLATGGTYSPRPLSFHLLFYLKHLPAIALPWTPIVALALWRAWQTGGFRDPRLRFLVCWAAAPVIAFTPAEWKLRYYLLPSIPPLALLAAPAAWQLLRQAPRRLDARALAGLAAVAVIALGAGLWATDAGVASLSVSDRSQVAALVSLVPGGQSGIVAALGFVAGVIIVGIAWRAWGALLIAAALVTVAWLLVGVPALEGAIAERDSLKEFAHAVGTRFPPPTALGFDRQLVRSVVVYAGRHIPTLRRRDARTPGLTLIATEDAYRELVQSGAAGPPLLMGTGRVGNTRRDRLVLFEVFPPPP
jgi:4-amino-4-deoxy-L-arabinose transferase-like glycosyltransferase